MEWNLIPEVFYDLIGRVVPGMLILLTVVMVALGPVGAIDLIINGSLKVNAWFTLLFLVASYFISIVLGNVWGMLSDISSRVKSRKDRLHLEASQSVGADEWAILFYKLRKKSPSETSRIIKIQAEKNMCEVLVIGLSVLELVNLWIWLREPINITTDRFWLLIGILISILSFWRWKWSLEKVYRETLVILKQVIKDLESDVALAGDKTPKTKK